MGGIWPLVSVCSNIQGQLSLAGSSVLRRVQAQAQGPVGPAQSDTQPAPQPCCPHWDPAPPFQFPDVPRRPPLLLTLALASVLPGTPAPSPRCLAGSLTSFSSLQMAHFPAGPFLTTRSLSAWHGPSFVISYFCTII